MSQNFTTATVTTTIGEFSSITEMEMELEEMVVVFYFGISVRGWNLMDY
jgi:hypothetical protein